MTIETQGRCFVIQRFDRGKYDKRYCDVFVPAITSVGLEPYRSDQDPAVDVPIEAIEAEIERATVCLADITLDNPNVWYEVGFAFAKGKPVCLVCWPERSDKFPFDIQHRTVLELSADAPADFTAAQSKISERLAAILKSRQTVEAARTLPTNATTSGLSPHEIAVLAHIAGQLDDPIGINRLRQLMDESGFTFSATGVATISLVGRSYIEKMLLENEWHNESETAFVLTDAGKQWLLDNQASLALRKPPRKGRGWSTEDDIPF